MTEIKMDEAIINLMQPFYNEFKNKDEKLVAFVQRFFETGGSVSIKLPEWIKEQMRAEQPKVSATESHQLITADNFDPGDTSDEKLSTEDSDTASGN